MTLLHDWDEFWFRPRSAAPLGLFRIVFGACVLAYALLLFPDRATWLTERGVIPTAASKALAAHAGMRYLPLNFLHGASEAEVTLFLVLFLLAALCLTVGWWTRAAAVLVFVGLNVLHNRDSIILNSGDTVMIVMAGYLALAPAGAACSLDRLRRVLRRGEDTAPLVMPWAQRLIQIQVCLVYLCTFLLKVQGEVWRNGTAAYYPLHQPEYARFPLPLTDGSLLWPLNLLTYGTMAAELALAILIWVPRLRLYVLAAGVLLHMGIEYSLNIPMFSFLMIASYLSFVTEADLNHFVAWMQAPLAPARLRMELICGGDGMPVFGSTVRFFDVFQLVTVAASSKIKGVSPVFTAYDEAGRKLVGVYALRALALRLPALCLAIPISYLPEFAAGLDRFLRSQDASSVEPEVEDVGVRQRTATRT